MIPFLVSVPSYMLLTSQERRTPIEELVHHIVYTEYEKLQPVGMSHGEMNG